MKPSRRCGVFQVVVFVLLTTACCIILAMGFSLSRRYKTVTREPLPLNVANQAESPKAESPSVLFCGNSRSGQMNNNGTDMDQSAASVQASNHKFPHSIRCDVLLNLFTSCIQETKDSRKIRGQIEVLRSYQRLNSSVQSWLFTESQEWAVKATELGINVVRKFEKTPHGTPCLSFMYKYVADVTQSHCGKQARLSFDAYTNCDIVFTGGLVDTLKAISTRWHTPITTGARKGVLVVGKRTNVDYHSEILSNDGVVTNLSAKRGQVYYNFAEDYFIYSRAARNWDQMPHFVVGRRAYDNWLVTDAFVDEQTDLIDASNTILALHLTASDGNSAGHAKLYDNDHNVQAFNPVTKKSVGPHEWNHGATDDAHFFTTHRNTSVSLVKRAHKAGQRSLPPEPAYVSIR